MADDLFIRSSSIVAGANLYGGVGQKTAIALPTRGTQLNVGYNAKNIDAATPLPFSPVQLVVLHLPTMYDDNPEFGKMLKTIIEGCPKQVNGIDFGYTADVQKTPNGNDGQEQAVPTRTKRSPVNPSMVFQEVTGNLIWNAFRQWLFDMHDPDTNAAMAHIKGGAQNFVSSAFSMTCLVIQYDPSMRPDQIIDAALYSNMFPTNTDNIGFEKQVATTNLRERTINFEAIVRHNAYVRNLGVQVATDLQLAKADYRYAVPEFDYTHAKEKTYAKYSDTDGNGIWSDSFIAGQYTGTNSGSDEVQA